MTDTFDYPCHGFHPSLPNGKAAGRLSVSEGAINAEIGSQPVCLPLAGATLKLGGASNRLVFINHPQQPQWRIYTSDRSILHNPILRAQPELAQAAARARRARTRAWAVLAAAVIALIALPTLLLLRMEWLTHHVAKQLPPQWEQQLGESALAQYRQNTPLMAEDRARALLNPLTAPLIDALPEQRYPFEFYVALDASVNAFALPGGTIVIHSGLILRADSAEELLGVIAHEITHITEQHGVRNVIGTAGYYLLISAVFGDVSGLAAAAANAAPFLLSQQYSRKFEREADAHGHKLLLNANINPAGLASFFSKMWADEKKQLTSIDHEQTRQVVERTLAMLSTHPTSAERIAYLQALPVPEQNFRNFASEFEQLQNAVRNVAAQTD